VDSGGGVVLSTFDGYYEASMPSWATSRINSNGYNPLSGGSTNVFHSVTLGLYNSSHPIMAGVTSLSSSQFNSDYTGVDAGATLIASWNNGEPLAAINAAGNVANITLFPNVAFYGHATGNYRELFRNALAYTAAPSTTNGDVPEPASLAIWGLGVLGCTIGAYRRRKRA
jgi:hypothetical protein